MSPSVRPVQPGAGFPNPADHRQTEQVIKAAAIDANVNDLALLEQVVQRHAVLGLGFPEGGTDPTVGHQSKADLDVEVLGQEAAHLRLAVDLGLHVQTLQRRPVNR